jgi:hypothetical protein
MVDALKYEMRGALEPISKCSNFNDRY